MKDVYLSLSIRPVRMNIGVHLPHRHAILENPLLLLGINLQYNLPIYGWSDQC